MTAEPRITASEPVRGYRRITHEEALKAVTTMLSANTITHQNILDRVEALGGEYSAAYRLELARINKERQGLQELCGGLGHIWGKSDFAIPVVGPVCRICGAHKPDTKAVA